MYDCKLMELGERSLWSVMGFVGENGAGKTTTIGCILNTLFRNSGSIQIFEKEMKDEDTVLRNDIGVVYDGDNFPKYLTAKQISEIMQGIFSQWDNSLFQKYLKTFRMFEAFIGYICIIKESNQEVYI